MADSKGSKSSNLALLKCGICLSIIDTPKTLPCLHTFCSSCLTHHAQNLAQKNPEKYTSRISCPACSKECELPRGGVQDLPTNHFVNKLKERYYLEQKFHEANRKSPCSTCDLPAVTMAGVCLRCKDFFCTKCLESHSKIKQEKQHRVVTLVEFRIGKFTMPNAPEEEICVEHCKDILLYCDICNKTMCDDCAGSDHSESNHKHIKLETIASDRNAKFQELYHRVKHIPKAFESSIAEDGKVVQELEDNIQTAVAECKRTLKTDWAESEFQHKLNELKSERKAKIEAHGESLQCQNAHLKRVLKLTKLVTKIGSDYDIIAMYPCLFDALQEAYKLNPTGIAKTISKVEFIPNEQPDVTSHGTLVTYDQWTFVKEMAVLEFNVGRGISIIANNLIVVTSLHAAILDRYREPVQIFDFNGVCQRELNPEDLGGDESSEPWEVVSSKDRQKCYLTDGNYVKVFDNSEGQFEFLYRFCAYKPDGSMSDKDPLNPQSRLMGLAIDSKDNIYIGSESYISIHDDLGKYIGGFDIPGMRPYYLAVTPNGHIVISDCGGTTSTVHIFDMFGTKLHTFETPPGLIPGETFHPTGLCVVHDEIFVSHMYMYRECAVYRYSYTGKYLGVVTTGVYEPYGIVLKDDTELLVLENDCIKVFHLR